jgi:putative ABC transport system permease protein
VLGASVRSIVLLLSKEFAVLVGIAFLVAAPVAYVVMSRWLEGFAFHAGLAWWIFALAGTAALGTALLTVGGHALRAALADPVRSLRSE